MGISKITRNYQVTLPKDVREVKNLRVGDKVLFAIEDDRIESLKVFEFLSFRNASNYLM